MEVEIGLKEIVLCGEACAERMPRGYATRPTCEDKQHNAYDCPAHKTLCERPCGLHDVILVRLSRNKVYLGPMRACQPLSPCPER